MEQRPEDVDALFARGWARSMRAVDLRFMQRSSFPTYVALQARVEHEKVLKLDPPTFDAQRWSAFAPVCNAVLPFLGIKLIAGGCRDYRI